MQMRSSPEIPFFAKPRLPKPEFGEIHQIPDFFWHIREFLQLEKNIKFANLLMKDAISSVFRP